MSVFSIVYVVIKCVMKNRASFRNVKSLSQFISLLYMYKVDEVDEDREIIMKKDDDKKYVTPGIPMIVFAFFTAIILFLYKLVI